jgi:hypothetical protein
LRHQAIWPDGSVSDALIEALVAAGDAVAARLDKLLAAGIDEPLNLLADDQQFVLRESIEQEANASQILPSTRQINASTTPASTAHSNIWRVKAGLIANACSAGYRRGDSAGDPRASSATLKLVTHLP